MQKDFSGLPSLAFTLVAFANSFFSPSKVLQSVLEHFATRMYRCSFHISLVCSVEERFGTSLINDFFKTEGSSERKNERR